MPFPPSGDLPDPGIEPSSPWQADSLPLSHLGSLYPVLHVPRDVCKVVGDSGSSLRMLVVIGGKWEEALT